MYTGRGKNKIIIIQNISNIYPVSEGRNIPNFWILNFRFLYKMELRHFQVLAGCPLNLILSPNVRALGLPR
jgi:hypothetical protein